MRTLKRQSFTCCRHHLLFTKHNIWNQISYLGLTRCCSWVFAAACLVPCRLPPPPDRHPPAVAAAPPTSGLTNQCWEPSSVYYHKHIFEVWSHETLPGILCFSLPPTKFRSLKQFFTLQFWRNIFCFQCKCILTNVFGLQWRLKTALWWVVYGCNGVTWLIHLLHTCRSPAKWHVFQPCAELHLFILMKVTLWRLSVLDSDRQQTVMRVTPTCLRWPQPEMHVDIGAIHYLKAQIWSRFHIDSR